MTWFEKRNKAINVHYPYSFIWTTLYRNYTARLFPMPCLALGSDGSRSLSISMKNLQEEQETSFWFN